MPSVIQVKRGQAAAWASADPILSPGEFGYETDTYKLKLGDGSTQWNSLPYLPLTADLDPKEDTANKGEPNGYASLDGSGLVPLTQLPEGIGGGIDSVEVLDDSLQFYAGTTPVGDPISLLISALDGGTPSTVTDARVDGGTL